MPKTKNVEAGLFSSVLGEKVSATNIEVEALSKNSQNMPLLQANISSSGIFEDKKKKEGEENPNLISSNALVPVTGPLGVADEADIGGYSSDQISVYVVRAGDSLSQIAEMFDITVDTILSANDMKKGDKPKEGDVLLILPFSGVEHTVTKGQTLQGIAGLYKVDLTDILIHNDIEADTKIAIGDKLMIPGANMLTETGKTVAKSPYSPASLKNISGYFINPVPTGKRSRGITATHKGVDIGAPTGTPIYASAAGRVTIARLGYNGGFGNLVIVSHPNGTETLYGHMSKLGTSTGAQVAQGEIIGYVGSTGRSTGPHLHFEVHGAKNPGTDWSWAK